MPPQEGVGNAHHEHAVGFLKLHLVRTRRIAQGEVPWTESGLTAVLPVDALAFELHLQEEHGDSGACHVGAQVSDGLRIRVDLAQTDVAQLRTRQAAVEVPRVQRVGYEWRERGRGRIIPELNFAARLHAGRRKGFKLRHALTGQASNGYML